MHNAQTIQPVTTCPVCRDLLTDRSGLCSRCGALIDTSGSAPKAHGMTCFSCGYQTDTVGDRCPACGRTYAVECDDCGEPVPIGKRNCPACGHDLAAAAHERVDSARKAPAGGPGRNGINWLLASVLIAGLAAMATGFVLRPEAFQSRFLTWLFVFSMGLFVLMMLLMGPRMGAKRVGRGRWRVKGELVEVYCTFDLLRAEYLVQVLRAERVPAFLHNRHGTTLTPFIFRGIEVMVPVERAEDAIGIMKAFGFDPDIETDNAEQAAPDSRGR